MIATVGGGLRRDQSRVGFELIAVEEGIIVVVITVVDIGAVLMPIVVILGELSNNRFDVVIVLFFPPMVALILSVSFKLDIIVVIEGTVKENVASVDGFLLIVTLDGPLEVVVDWDVV